MASVQSLAHQQTSAASAAARQFAPDLAEDTILHLYWPASAYSHAERRRR